MRNLLEVYPSSVEGPKRKGRPLGRWDDRVKEYVSERGVRGNGLELARRKCMDRERWRSVCRGRPIVAHFWREQGIRAIDCDSISYRMGKAPIEVVDSFCYLGNVIRCEGGAESAVRGRILCA